MKKIEANQRVFKGFHVFYPSHIKKETEKAFLIMDIGEYSGEEIFFWIPRSKVLFCELPESTNKIQYFIPSFFLKKQAVEGLTGSTVEERMNKANSLFI